MEDVSCVRVGVRIRPQIPREIIDMCHVCTSVTPTEPQVWLGKDKAFTFDHVFDMPTTQEEIYEACVLGLVEGCFEGYNATVLAYGQTGSGKTYTMGTGFDITVNHEERGIIPRAVEHLFLSIQERQRSAKDRGEAPPEFKINAQFMELYNEEIIDLLDPAKEVDEKSKKSHIKIHEDACGGIYTVGVTTRSVLSVEEALQCLKIGALSRTTASTRMNAQSSRSHAIFTLHIKQQRIVKIQSIEDQCGEPKVEEESLNEFETLTAKFHFVDLAGSERLKRTGATGERAKEGISINCGLLALGNVISALGDKSRKVSHIPYRDSKLTRLLQDSLGGNSRTLMIACVSPSDRDFMETLNTLKYANRAKNIKNKVMVNQDKSSQTIAALRREIQQLQLELMEYKQGKRVVGEDGTEQINDMFHENTMLQTENSTLRTRIKALQETVERLTIRNSEMLAERAAGTWITSDGEGSKSDISALIQGYLKEVEELMAKLMESEEMCSQLRKQVYRPHSRLSSSPTSTAVAVTGQYDIRMDTSPSVYELLEEAKQDIKKLKKKKKRAMKEAVEKEVCCSDDEKQEDGHQKLDADEDAEINGDDNSCEDDTTESEFEEQENYSEDLAELTCEISIKQKLIDQLELSQRRLQTMRQHYEEKLIQLQNKIRETERERDRVLSNLSKSSENQAEEKVHKVKDDFEKKLNALQNDLKKMQAAKKEHSQMMKNQAQYERQLKQLRQEVSDMKKAKVRLVHKMKEEVQRHKESEQKRNREIAQLKKEGRMKENQIRTLEAEKKLKEAVLRRKQEEVTALRKLAKPMSDRVAGRISRGRKSDASSQRNLLFSPKLAKQRWQNLEKKISKLVLSKQSVYTVEKDMERWLHEREKLSRCLEKVLRKRDRAILDNKGDVAIHDLEEEIESLKANIDYIHENIAECQTSIVQMEESKDDMDAIDANTLLANLHLEESKYLMEKLLNMAINQSFQVAQKEVSVKELEAELKQVVESNAVQQQLLQYVYQASHIVPPSTEQDDLDILDTSRSPSPLDNNSATEPSLFASDSLGHRAKARKRAATTEELLFVGHQTATEVAQTSLSSTTEETGILTTPSLSVCYTTSTGFDTKLPSQESAPDRENTSDVTTPPCSPLTRRNCQSSVFSRLSSTSSETSSKPDIGTIISFANKPTNTKNSLLVCTHIAEGHSKAVLCVEATDDVLFSSSKDQTVKIWDLHTGQEIQSLGGHPSKVVAVRYCEYTRLAFTVSMAYIKVWDVRENPAKCIKTLRSSGVSSNGSMVLDSPSVTMQMPPGETQINDISLNHYGSALFSAAGNNVRIWDLKMFQSTGKLSGGHQAAVMCLAVDDLGMDNNLIITGSKDHYIKVFEVMEGMVGLHTPKVTLEPPHCDGVQCLSISGDFLFSGSRDKCIKKWDLASQSLIQSIDRAHRDYICALSFLPSGNMILSGCRTGHIKVWTTDSCQLLGEIRAHGAPVNSICVNSSNIFTASDDCSIGVWRLRSSSDASPDYSDFGDERFFH